MPYPSLDHSNFFGNRALVIEVLGELSTDLYGLTTCSLTAKCPQDRWDLVPPLFDYHPLFSYLNVERQRIQIKDGFLWINLEYAGITGAVTTPIYELSLGVGETPIEAHPKFATQIGGTPSAPLNGAIFLHPSTNQITTDNTKGVFDRFASQFAGGPNIYAGVTSYIDFGQATWRVRQYQTFQPADISYVGKISWPEGPAPSLGGARNWLLQSVNFERRGNVYGVTKEWRASGPRGWDPIVYGFG
jgi:hypothetical protein